MTEITEIIEACKNGENLARKLLYERYSNKMRLVCYRYLGNMMDTEDIVHEGFLIVFDKIGQYNGKGSFDGWIVRIFINASLNFLKRKGKSNILLGNDMIEYWNQQNIEAQLPTEESTKQQDIIRNMDFSKEELLCAMQLLPEGYRTVFNLYVFEKNNHKEIAEMLSIAESTSRTQLKRARKYLQHELYKMSLEKSKKQDDENYNNIMRVVS